MTADAEIIAELRSVLARQLSRLSEDDLDSLLPDLDRAGELVASLSGQRSDELEEVAELHRRLQLALADRKQAVAERLAATRAGGRITRAYGRGAPGASDT